MALTFSAVGYLDVRLHRKQLEEASLNAAEGVSDLIARSTSEDMMRNDRESLRKTISALGSEPGIVRVRIIDRNGLVSISSDPNEVNHVLHKDMEGCNVCHNQGRPATATLQKKDRFRIFRAENGERVLGVINAIENTPSCYNAACHAHAAGEKVLGILDTHVSLARADAEVRAATMTSVLYSLSAALGISLLAGFFVWRLVHRPVRLLKAGTEHLIEGELGYQINVNSNDEVGELADSFNQMSLRLRAANEEIKAWAYILEERVEEKTSELGSAYERMLQVEKMASIGKLAAVVAHEVNNPLAGILTYAKLIRRWLEHDQLSPERMAEARQCLELIESESRRCGDLLKNLLTFSRTAPMNLAWSDLNEVMNRCVKLVLHKTELSSIHLQVELDQELPLVHCDPAHIEQVVLALVMNAIDAMPRGGNLWLSTRWLPESKKVELEVRDDGNGIAPDLLSKLFEPFVTTKERGKGVGLGLAISRNIVDRHNGQIKVDSEPGRGTRFQIFLPQDANDASFASKPQSTVAGQTR
jgi:two-component system NtrC family sensor kinase